MKILPRTLLLILLIIITVSCSRNTRQTGPNVIYGSGTKYAERFTLENRDGLEILTIRNPWQGASGVVQTWILARYGQVIPQGLDTSHIIRVPVRRVIAMSTTFLSMIDALGETQKVAGISGSSLLYDSSLREQVKAGKIADVGYDENLGRELVVRIRPDVVIVYGIGGESSGSTGKLKDMGINVLFDAGYLENDPLGKAEWIKVYGALFSKEKLADSLFASIVSQYDSVRLEVAERSADRPAVLLGLPWKDTWFVSPGNSYISRMISDAGGEYIWKETDSETSMPYSLENVWVKAMKADFWLNIGTVTTPAEILSVDRRLGDLPVFKRGDLYNNNNRMSESGGNDYWESGSVRPQVILKDIAAILHPSLFPGYTYFYYRKVR